MSDENDYSSVLSRMREKPRSVIYGAFRQGMILTGIRLLFNYLQSGRVFGLVKQWLTMLIFSGERFVFQYRERLHEKYFVLRAILSIIRPGLWPTFLSLLCVIVTYWLQYSITLPVVLRDIVASLSHNQFFLLTGTDSKTTYITLLTTIAGITGVFIALYFTTLCMVAISYSEPQHREIRNLVIENAVSRGYLFMLAHLGAVCLFGLAFLGVGYPPNILLMIYVLLIAGISVFSFFLLGWNIFQLLDPRKLVYKPKSNFLKSIRNATIYGSRWENTAFQHHFRKQVLRELYRFECLMEFALSKPASNEVVRDLCITLLNLLIRYTSDSQNIPSLSMWFPRKRIFPKWGFTSSIQADIALRTGTTPQPEEVPDYMFVCKAISKLVRRSLDSFITRQDYSDLASVLHHVHHVIGKMGDKYAIEEARILLGEIRDILFSGPSEPALNDIALHDRPQAITIASIYGACLLNLAISASQSLETKPVEGFLATYLDLKSCRQKHLYRWGHPRVILRYMEDLQNKLIFEYETQRRLCSADWFLKEQLARHYADYIWSLSEFIHISVKEFCIEPLCKITEEPALLPRAELLRASIETIKKVRSRIDGLSELHHRFEIYAVTKEDWQTVDFKLLKEQLQNIEAELLNNISGIAHNLATDADAGDNPDYAGIFRAYIGDALVWKMATQKLSKFEILFDGYFKTTMEVVKRHIVKKDPHFSKPHIKVAIDTTIDLLGLSGLALLFNELYGSQVFEIVKKVWDKYFCECPDPKQAITYFYHSINMTLQLPVLSPSGNSRLNWERIFVEFMANMGFDIERSSTRYDEESVRTKHHSRIIQSIYPHMGMMFNHPYDYFVAYYLSKRPEADGIDLPNSANNCIHDVDRENERRQGGTQP